MSVAGGRYLPHGLVNIHHGSLSLSPGNFDKSWFSQNTRKDFTTIQITSHDSVLNIHSIWNKFEEENCLENSKIKKYRLLCSKTYRQSIIKEAEKLFPGMKTLRRLQKRTHRIVSYLSSKALFSSFYRYLKNEADMGVVLTRICNTSVCLMLSPIGGKEVNTEPCL